MTKNQKDLIWNKWLDHFYNKPDDEAIIHITFDEEPYIWTYRSLIMSALHFMTLLKNKGVKQGDVCGLVFQHNIYFYPLYLGASMLGAVTTVLAYKNSRLHPDKFRAGLEGIAKRSGLDWVLTEQELSEMLMPAVGLNGSTIKGLIFPLNFTEEFDDKKINIDKELEGLQNLWLNVQADDIFLLQHSSGTTGLQKGVSLSHKAILQHAENYSEAILLGDDKIVSWLPLYHDMGLIAAFTIPLIKGVTTIQIDPFDWVTEPVMLMQTISQFNATLAWLPNFSYYVLADKVHRDDVKDLNLSSLRMLINCSEPVTHEAHEKIYQKYKDVGLRRECLTACYAMAETTYAITQTKPGEQAMEILTDQEKLAKGEVEILHRTPEAKGRVCVSSGMVIKGCQVKIVTEANEELPDCKVGDIMVSSVSLFNGYKNNPEQTSKVLNDNWFKTGDFGFFYQNELFVIGRKKDIIIVAGKNIYPEDIEIIVGKIEGVIPGRVMAFGNFEDKIGTEQIHVIVESHLPENEHAELSKTIIKKAAGESFFIHKVVIKPSRWLVKSSSGKLSRSENKIRTLQQNT
ncbi:AMP-binding protein [Mucilaginibacter calamicampi]|uniref:AMP-binding protein n=1 Tax=Mucilaginibacter calamicampi TaxID=1302352 RepID=A0ABW2YYM0_9SPHI